MPRIEPTVPALVRELDTGSAQGGVAGDGKLSDGEIRNHSGGYDRLLALSRGLPDNAAREDLFSRLEDVARAKAFAQALGMTPAADLSAASERDTYRQAYKNGDVVFLVGNLDDAWTEKEWDRFYGIAKWCVNNAFRVVINPVAQVADVRAAAQDERTKVIIWSSHASSDGVVRDADNVALPEDVFLTDAGRNLRQVIFSACTGDKVSARYKTSDAVTETYWEGTTTSDDLFGYLYGKKWNPKQYGENVYDAPESAAA